MDKDQELLITKKVLHTIAKGACIMASGGGGSYQVVRYRIDKDYKDDYEVTCVPARKVNDKGWFAGASCMFPPTALTKKTDAVSPFCNVYEAIEKWCVNNGRINPRFKNCKKFDYYHPLEVGAVNTVIPIIGLAQMNKNENRDIKVIDADTAGRSIPTLPLIIFAAYTKNPAISWFPNYVASKTVDKDGGYYTGQFDLPDGTKLEEAFITLIMNEFDKYGGFTVFPMTGKTLKKDPSVFGTLSDAYNVGSIYENKKYSYRKKADKIVKYFNDRDRRSKIIFTGIITSIDTQQYGTDVGSVMIEGIDKDEGYILELGVSNENILAYKYKKGKKKKIYILGPDSMCYVPLNGKIDVMDNSDLANFLNCPNAPKIKVNVIGISAPKIVSSKPKLIENWSKEWSELGYKGKKYKQPWLDES